MEPAEELKLGLASIELEIKTMMRRVYGRDLEFVVVVFDLGRISETGQVPGCFQVHTMTTPAEAINIALEVIKACVPKPDAVPPTNLH